MKNADITLPCSVLSQPNSVAIGMIATEMFTRSM